MAAKKEQSVEDGVKIFKDVIKRASLNEFIHVNRSLYGITTGKKNTPVMMTLESELWNHIIDDPDLKSKITELDITKVENLDTKQKMIYADDMLNSDGWFQIDEEKMTKGDIIHISLDGYQYDIPINKVLFPIKFKKSESNNFYYKVFLKPSVVLVLKKKYESPVEGSSFYLGRAFRVL